MILKGSQRLGAGQLARHSLKSENEYVELDELRGFMADELPGALQEAYAISQGKAFAQTLKARGFHIARGDRRGFAAVDFKGEIYAIAKWTGVRTKEFKARLGDPKSLLSVSETKAIIAFRMNGQIKTYISETETAFQKHTAQLADIRLAPLYDLVSTVYYPELTPKMAMKIGGESGSDKLRPRNFEKLAIEANLAKPMVIQRVPELARTVLETIDEIDIVHPVGRDVMTLIKERCERFIRLFHSS